MVDKSQGYDESDAASANQTPRPIPSEGIGRRISAVADALGTRRNAAQVGGISVDSLQRYIRGDNTPPFDVIARMCSIAGVRMEWLATGEGPMRAEALADNASQHARLDVGTLQKAAEVLERALDQAGATTDAAGRAELLVAIYELLEQGSALEAAQRVVANMLRAASKAAGVPKQ